MSDKLNKVEEKFDVKFNTVKAYYEFIKLSIKINQPKFDSSFD